MSAIHDMIIYTKMSVKTILRYPSFRTIYSCFKYYSSWRKYLADEDGIRRKIPWISFEATDYLEGIVDKDMNVFEYGSGGSTLFWSMRAKKVVSVEHDRKWFEKTNKELLDKKIQNVEYVLSEPTNDPDYDKKDFKNPGDYISSDINYHGKNFAEYVKTIDKFPDGFFHIVVVDGRARPSCIQHALKKIIPGGYLIVDNSEREYYLASLQNLNHYLKMRKFAGPVPYVHNFSETTVLQTNMT